MRRSRRRSSGCFGCSGEGRASCGASSMRWWPLGGVAVVQRLQEGDDVLDLGSGQGGLVPGASVEWRLDVDVGVVFGRQIVEFAHGAVAVARIPFLRLGIAL